MPKPPPQPSAEADQEPSAAALACQLEADTNHAIQERRRELEQRLNAERSQLARFWLVLVAYRLVAIEARWAADWAQRASAAAAASRVDGSDPRGEAASELLARAAEMSTELEPRIAALRRQRAALEGELGWIDRRIARREAGRLWRAIHEELIVPALAAADEIQSISGPDPTRDA